LSGIAIGIDLGTSGVRAALVDADREPVGQASAPIAAADRRDPAAWWRAVEAAIGALGATHDLSGLRALAVDGTSGTILAIDADARPLGPASLYNDQADARSVERIDAIAPADSAARGATSPLARLPAHGTILHEADWIAGRLCGRFVSDANNALKTGYDSRIHAWPDWIGDDLARLPNVVEPGTPIGTVLADVAAAFGIPATARVVAGTTDGCAAFLATGADEPGDGVSSLGTTLTLKVLSDAPVFAPKFGIYSHRLLGRWLPGGASNTGGAALLAHFDARTLAELSARIDPSRDSGLDYYPLPRPGERFPIADARFAPRERPRPSDDALFLHGLLEGIARIEARAYQKLTELGAPKLRSVRSVGGGATNAVWTAIRARMLGVDLLAARSEEAAVGTAGLALLGAAA